MCLLLFCGSFKARDFWLRLGVWFVLILGAIVLSFFSPSVASIIMIGLPLVIFLSNLGFEHDNRRPPRKKNTNVFKRLTNLLVGRYATLQSCVIFVKPSQRNYQVNDIMLVSSITGILCTRLGFIYKGFRETNNCLLDKYQNRVIVIVSNVNMIYSTMCFIILIADNVSVVKRYIGAGIKYLPNRRNSNARSNVGKTLRRKV